MNLNESTENCDVYFEHLNRHKIMNAALGFFLKMSNFTVGKMLLAWTCCWFDIKCVTKLQYTIFLDKSDCTPYEYVSLCTLYTARFIMKIHWSQPMKMHSELWNTLLKQHESMRVVKFSHWKYESPEMHNY